MRLLPYYLPHSPHKLPQIKSEALKGSTPAKHHLNLDTVLFFRAPAPTRPHSIPSLPELIHGYSTANQHFIAITAPSQQKHPGALLTSPHPCIALLERAPALCAHPHHCPSPLWHSAVSTTL